MGILGRRGRPECPHTAERENRRSDLLPNPMSNKRNVLYLNSLTSKSGQRTYDLRHYRNRRCTANAVHNACGIRVLPITPGKLLPAGMTDQSRFAQGSYVPNVHV